MSKLEHKRILLKFSGESVAGNDEHGIDPKILDNMAGSVKSCKEIGAEIGIVIGGGNLFRGEKLSKAGMDRVAGDHMGMLATVMNGIALRDALERAGVKTRVMSAISMSGVAEHYDRRLAIQLLANDFVVIFTAGTGNPFFSTDNMSGFAKNYMFSIEEIEASWGPFDEPLEIIRELPITLILRPFNFETFATTAYISASEDLLEAAAAPALFLILIATTCICLLYTSPSPRDS